MIDRDGLPLWPGCLVHEEDTNPEMLQLVLGPCDNEGGIWLSPIRTRPFSWNDALQGADPVPSSRVTLALHNPDTLRSFDGRLLEQIGASKDQTLEGTSIHPSGSEGNWWFTAGGKPTRLFSRLLKLDTRDPLEARRRAWHLK